MTLVLGAFGLRFIIYSLLTNPWHILPVELLQGVTYGIFYSNMASYAYGTYLIFSLVSLFVRLNPRVELRFIDYIILVLFTLVVSPPGSAATVQG